MEGLMYLSHPLYAKVMELLAQGPDGKLGRVRSVSGRYAANIASLVNPLGRGTIYNIGCYPTSLLHLVMQTACGPDAFARRTCWGAGILAANGSGTVGEATLSVRFDCGVLANLQASDEYGMSHEFAINGDKGVLRFVTNPWLPMGEGKLNVLTFMSYEKGAKIEGN